MTDTLKAPFPYFGGKSKVAPIVWQRFGRIDNYVEPFFGSGAVLLACPQPGHTETVNDADALLTNFFRALQADPEAVAYHADYPVSELDLHARHRWLVKQRADVERLLDDPTWFDVQAAGWWVWGISQWIGSGWCPPEGARGRTKDGGVWQQSPYLKTDAQGVHRKSFGQLPHMGGNGDVSKGVHGLEAQSNLVDYFHALAARLRRVRVTCGDFARVLGPSVTWRHGTTAVFLDPPYDLSSRASVYAVETDAAHRARAWAIANGDNPLLRIAYCGYEDGAEWPEGWQAYRWKTSGGYGSQGNGRGRENANREVIYFSPHCVYKTPLEQWADEVAA